MPVLAIASRYMQAMWGRDKGDEFENYGYGALFRFPYLEAFLFATDLIICRQGKERDEKSRKYRFYCV